MIEFVRCWGMFYILIWLIMVWMCIYIYNSLIYTLKFFNISKKVNDRALEIKKILRTGRRTSKLSLESCTIPTYFRLLEFLAVHAFLPSKSEALLSLLCSSHEFWICHLTYSLPVFPCVSAAITWSLSESLGQPSISLPHHQPHISL